MAAAAVASLATSAPPPDWTQEDELTDVPVQVAPGETTTLSVFVQMPRESDNDRSAEVRVEAPEGKPVSVIIRPDGASKDCDAIKLPAPAASTSAEPDAEVWHRLYFECLGDTGSSAEVRRVLRLSFTTTGNESLDLRVSVKARAWGYDDDPQDPPVLLELR